MIGWAIETLVATALLMVLVMALRGPVRQMSGSGIAYALWLLPLARLLLPPLPGNWQLSRLIAPLVRQTGSAPGVAVGVLNPAMLSPDLAAKATIASAAIGNHHATAALMPLTAVSGGPDIATLALFLWLAGAALFLTYHLIAHILFCRRLLQGAVAGPTVAAGRVRLIESDAADSPLAFGIVRRYVAFPRDFAVRCDADERDLALLHELGHHQRGDLIANWAALVMLALHWFDPIAWRAFRAFRADQEMANDARVLAGRSAVERHAYACTIVKAAHPGFGAVAATCHLNSVDDLKGRLKMLTTGRASRTRVALGAATIAGLTIAGLGLTASGRVAARTVQSSVTQSVDVDHQSAAPQASEPAHRHSHVTIVKNGKRTDYEGAEAEAYIAARPEAAPNPPMPPAPPVMPAAANSARAAPSTPPVLPVPPRSIDTSRMVMEMPNTPGVQIEVQDIPAVSQAKCGIGSGKPTSMLVQHGDGQKRMIVVCTDRIEQLAANAAAAVGDGHAMERNAYAQALAGLLDARTKMVADVGMKDADRARALLAIDQSIAEMRGQLARMN